MAWSARRRSSVGSRLRRGVLERADAQVAGGDPHQHGAGQHRVAGDLLAGGHDGEGAGGGDAERVHRLAHQVLAQHRPDGRLAVAATGERRAPGALEVQVAPPAVRRRRPRRAAAPARRRGAATSRRTGARRRPARPARRRRARRCRRARRRPRGCAAPPGRRRARRPAPRRARAARGAGAWPPATARTGRRGRARSCCRRRTTAGWRRSSDER